MNVRLSMLLFSFWLSSATTATDAAGEKTCITFSLDQAKLGEKFSRARTKRMLKALSTVTIYVIKYTNKASTEATVPVAKLINK